MDRIPIDIGISVDFTTKSNRISLDVTTAQWIVIAKVILMEASLFVFVLPHEPQREFEVA